MSSAPDHRISGAAREATAGHPRTILKVVVTTLAAISLATGVSVVVLYRHYSSNIAVFEIGKAVKNTPRHRVPSGPTGALNILVMGSDNRDAPGDRIDSQAGKGKGKRSDTTILLHLSADRRHAYGISIPRDSVVRRAACFDRSGRQIAPATTGVMWNDAFNVGGPACTIEQFQALTHIPVDHFIVVDFAGFKAMVDAIGGVDVCIPHAVSDPAAHITLLAGNHKLSGTDALSYVREREALGNGSDIDRIRRQQAFIASMAHAAVSANTLANPIHLARFLDAATRSLTVDPGLHGIGKLVGLVYQLRHIGLSKIQFVTTPTIPDPANINRVVWTPAAAGVWKAVLNDRPLPGSITSGSITAQRIPGVTPGSKPGSSRGTQNLDAGLCA
jgi:LCP family protein required for cell wall assembly